MKKVYLYYDEEGDFFEINLGKYSDGPLEDLGNGIAIKIDNPKNNATIMISGFTKKIKELKEIKLPFLNNSYILIYYDEEGDFLEIFIGKPTKSNAIEIEQGIYIRKDEKTNEVKSIGIISFKKRANLKDIELNLPIEVIS